MKKVGNRRKAQLIALQSQLEYNFSDISLLDEATCHDSWLYDGHEAEKHSNERLEFLGDLIIAFAIGDFMFHQFSDMSEADYSRIKSRIASRKHLYKVGVRLNLGQYMLLSKGEEQNQGRKKISIISSAVESIVAAIYIDSSLAVAKEWILQFLKEDILDYSHNPAELDYKSHLQEYLLKKDHKIPEYVTITEKGPAHARQFVSQVTLDSLDEQIHSFKGYGSSKKEAQKDAARRALDFLREKGYC